MTHLTAVTLSHGVCSEESPSLAVAFLLPVCSTKFRGLATLTKLNTEMRICRATFRVVTLILTLILQESARIVVVDLSVGVS